MGALFPLLELFTGAGEILVAMLCLIVIQRANRSAPSSAIPEATSRRWEKFKYIGNRTRAQFLQVRQAARSHTHFSLSLSNSAVVVSREEEMC